MLVNIDEIKRVVLAYFPDLTQAKVDSIAKVVKDDAIVNIYQTIRKSK